jgi:zinc/manganese transport system substrate-binding protein
VRTTAVKTAIGLSAIVVGLIGSTTVTGCSNGPHPTVDTVLASTGVWGSVAVAVAGGHVTVRSILTNAEVDPHTYQVSPVDEAAIADAPLVVYNGGGYDPWAGNALAAHPATEAINAYSLLHPEAGDGRDYLGHGGHLGYPGHPNEHVFYNVKVAKAVATMVADKLATIDPNNATDYRANAAEFGRGADAIAGSEHAIAAAHSQAHVIATEPVAHYLLAACNLVNQAPASFTTATENGSEPSPADMAYVLDLITNRKVSALLVNPQAATAATNDIQTAARRAGVPVTEVSETLPTGTDYLTWQSNTVNSLAAALRPPRYQSP